MKDYELTVVFHPDLEMNIDPSVEKVKKVITSCGGKITKEEAEGKKRLAYDIKKQDFGVYYYFDVALPAEAPSKISTTFNINDEILRYLLVKAEVRRSRATQADEPADTDEEAPTQTNDTQDVEDTKSTEEKGE